MGCSSPQWALWQGGGPPTPIRCLPAQCSSWSPQPLSLMALAWPYCAQSAKPPGGSLVIRCKDFMRKTQRTVTTLLSLPLLGAISSGTANAHDERLHMIMSSQAAISSQNLGAFGTDNLLLSSGSWIALSYNGQPFDPITWIELGSRDEDHRGPVDTPNGSTGTRHHFYTPVPRDRRTKALADPPTQMPGERPPIDSFKWASDHKANDESWRKARDYEFEGFTRSSKSERDASLGHMFKTLGHVIHLNQDLSQPGHTRDDNHGTRAYIEDFGIDYYKTLIKKGSGA